MLIFSLVKHLKTFTFGWIVFYHSTLLKKKNRKQYFTILLKLGVSSKITSIRFLALVFIKQLTKPKSSIFTVLTAAFYFKMNVTWIFILSKNQFYLIYLLYYLTSFFGSEITCPCNLTFWTFLLSYVISSYAHYQQRFSTFESHNSFHCSPPFSLFIFHS